MKQEIVYVLNKKQGYGGKIQIHTEGDFPYSAHKKKGYFFTQEELQKLLEDVYFEGECFGIGTDGCINKQEYINKLFK